MATRSGRHRRHHPYDVPAPRRSAGPQDRTAQAIIAAMSAAVIAGGLWSVLHGQLTG